MKVVIIDNQVSRKNNLEQGLINKGVDAMSFTLMEYSLHRVSHGDIFILLAQQINSAAEFIEEYINPKTQIILTDAPEIYNQYRNEYIIFLVDSKEGQANLVSQIDTLFASFNKAYFMPIAVDENTINMLSMAKKAAQSKATILIHGETGSGKEVLAQYIHHHSLHAEGPFVSVNCAALPENMIEALLFGHEKGAFTGAVNQHIGKFEQAQNGSLFLDEISELPLSLQAKLLRALQEKEIERLGARQTIKINARIIAASNKDLKQQVHLGEFRKDLYYRLNVIAIACPALRERSKDIIPLADYFIKKYARELEKTTPLLTSAAKHKLSRYSWPGNVREMDNVIHRAVVMTESDLICEKDITLDDSFCDIVEMRPLVENADNFKSKLAVGEARIILDILQETAGCRQTAAQKLNISPRTLRYKIAKLKSIGLNVP